MISRSDYKLRSPFFEGQVRLSYECLLQKHHFLITKHDSSKQHDRFRPTLCLLIHQAEKLVQGRRYWLPPNQPSYKPSHRIKESLADNELVCL